MTEPTNKRKITAEDLYRLKFVSDPQISPAGAEIAFVQTEVDPETKEYHSQIWLVSPGDPPDGPGFATWPQDSSESPPPGQFGTNAGGNGGTANIPTPGTPRRFTGGPKSDTSPRWSPEGRTLAFVSDRSGDKQIWLISLDGGEARQLTRMKHGVSSPVWSPAGSHLAFLSKAGPDEKYGELIQTKKPQEKEAQEKKAKEEVKVIDRIRYKADEGGLLDGKFNHLWVIPVAGGNPRQLTSGEYDVAAPTWSPDGRFLAFSANPSPDRDHNPAISDIWTIPAEGGTPRRLTTSLGPASQPSWSPDGKKIAYFGHDRQYNNATLTRLWVVPFEAGGLASEPASTSSPAEAVSTGPKDCQGESPLPLPICLTSDFDRSLGDQGMSDMRAHHPLPGPIWSPDGSQLYFLASDKGNTHVYGVAAQGGPVTQISQGMKQIFGLSADATRKLAAVAFTDPLTPGDLALISLTDGSEKRATWVNDSLLKEITLNQPEEINFTAPDGWRIQGWMMKPAGFQPGKRYPMILEIHGGPHSMYSNSFFLEFQLLAANGYVVLYTNPRGSHGYGQEFVRAVQGDYGGKDFGDLMAALDYAVTLDFIDAERLGVTGGSYGGFMTNWVVGHTNRFKAAVTQRSISNWISFYGTSDIGYHFTEWEIEGNPWADTAKLLAHSPLTYVENVQTPLLILHSEQDLRCPIEQAEQFFVALKRLKRESQLVRFPNSNHDLSRNGKPVLRTERLNRIVGWFNRFIERRPEDHA